MIPFGRIGGRVGAYAQAAAVDPGWLAPLSTDIDDATAATLPLNALTARQALDMIGRAAGRDAARDRRQRRRRRLRHAARRPRRGCRVLAQASDDDEDWVASLGASEVLPRDTDLATHRPRRRRPRRRPARARRPPPRCATAAIAVFTRPPRRRRRRAGIRFETVLVQIERRAAARADRATSRPAGCARASPSAAARRRRARPRAQRGGRAAREGAAGAVARSSALRRLAPSARVAMLRGRA